MRTMMLCAIVLGLGVVVAGGVSAQAVATAAPADAAAEAARKACFEGRWLLIQNRLDEAIAKLEMALSLSPNSAEAKDLMAQAQGRRAETEKHCDQAVALAGQGRWDEAIQEVQWALMVYSRVGAGQGAAAGRQAAGRRGDAEERVGPGGRGKPGGGRGGPAAVAGVRSRPGPAREALARLDAQRGRAAGGPPAAGGGVPVVCRGRRTRPRRTPSTRRSRRCARAVAVERLRFAVVQHRPQRRARQRPSSATPPGSALAAIKPDFLDVAAAPNAAPAGAMAVAVDAGADRLRTAPPKVEARTMSYKANVQEPNPDYVLLSQQRAACLDNLSLLQAAAQRPCVYCGGAGWCGARPAAARACATGRHPAGACRARCAAAPGR